MNEKKKEIYLSTGYWPPPKTLLYLANPHKETWNDQLCVSKNIFTSKIFIRFFFFHKCQGGFMTDEVQETT